MALAGAAGLSTAAPAARWAAPSLYLLAAALAIGLAAGPHSAVALPDPSSLRPRPRPAILALALASWGAALVLLGSESILAGSVAWLLSLAALPFAFVGAADFRRSALGRIGRSEAAAVLLLLALGAALRFCALGAYPPGMHDDEAGWGLIAAAILEGVGPYPYGVAVVTDPPSLAYAFTSDPALPAYAAAAGVAALGRTVEGIRAVPALVGWLSLAALYWLARLMFGARPALIALALLATNHVNVHFSRVARGGGPPVLLFTTLAFACLWAGLSRGRPVWYVLAGIFAGLDLYAHFGARPLPLVLGAALALAVIRRRTARRAWWRPAGLVALGLGAALGPDAQFYLGHPDLLVAQEADRFIFNNPGAGGAAGGPADAAAVLWHQLAAYLLAFVQPLPRSEFHPGGPDALFVAPAAPLVILGIAFTIAQWRDPRHGLLLLWFVGFLAAGVLSTDAPQLHRVLAALPAAALMAGALGDELINRARTALPAGGGLAGRAAMTVLLLVGGVEDGRAFFVRSAARSPWRAETLAAAYIASQPPDAEVIVAGAPRLSADDPRVRYLAPGRAVRDMANPPLQLAQLAGTTAPVTFAVDGGAREWLPVIEAYFPGGAEERVRGDDAVLGYHLAASAAPRRAAADPTQGLELRLVDAAGLGEPVRVAPFVAYREAAALAGGSAFEASWRGLLAADRPGPHEVEVITSGDAQLFVDGRLVLQVRERRPQPARAAVELAPRQAIELRYRHRGGRGMLELYWRRPGGPRELLPPGSLEPPQEGPA